MAYASWSVTFGEQPSAAKWNILGTNDAYFDEYIDRSGFPVQIKGNSSTAVNSGTTVFPVDDTVPQSGEGIEFMTQAITPTSATNILKIEAIALLASSVQNNLALALFQDATAGALAAAVTQQFTANVPVMVPLRHTMVAGTTSSTTFKIRGGGSAAGTTTFNGVSAGRYFGAITKSSLIITEYKA